MIRRQVEYVIICDSERVLGRECSGGRKWNSFGCDTLKDCALEAMKAGWSQISARYWLCPECRQHHPAEQRTKANLKTLGRAVGVEIE